MRFSQRLGITPVRKVLQVDDLDEELRIDLWNTFLDFSERDPFLLDQSNGAYGIKRGKLRKVGRVIWSEFLKKPADDTPTDTASIMGVIKRIFLHSEWFEVYDFLEFWVSLNAYEKWAIVFNKKLENALAGYRIINGRVCQITDEVEISEIEIALAQSENDGVKIHLQSALKMLSEKKSPDCRNSIKESISAVELVCRQITGENTLGKSLSKLRSSGEIPSVLSEGFTKLYAWTNGSNGIRHALMEEPNLSVHEAKYFLVSCTSFINYLRSNAPSNNNPRYTQ